MSFTGSSEYDRGTNTFSPEGRLFQVEYAIEAIKLGSTAIGIVTSEGVILASEKRVESKLLEPASIEKIFEIDQHMGCAMSGLMPDARTLIDLARSEALGHWFTYDERMPVESLVDSVSNVLLDFSDTEKKKKLMSRPFGVALLIAGVDPIDGPMLYFTDPSGTFTKCRAYAIGAACESVRSGLQDNYTSSMTFEEAEKLAVEQLKATMEGEIKATNIEVASVRVDTGKFKMYSSGELEAVIKRVLATSTPDI
uniref:Proteasome subunit alpha type n=1 Tax=Noctiluca scintillans TaxID=2966 RepID=A0A7S1FIM8_NOCSC|mmetsp:Transcript_63975/g.169352  ORF Transcript_63975/g.169352 Transcript_63975/m.169352 type:complete len:253 (+) Transcript_63975:69-827(+)|eukprot:CAMPEP_0194503750 /NCGR_PEP_ID=MMETSP0253-20130528/28553_1 /TAXON_ID=2966 /ORGANISM="Noctiluca scintillans" /LENGTH=252 /DNA_ID=CAMNT_0039346061 /DNA_START=69 /DNA_END=827 /DNA_ORIENTATION=-